MFNSNNSPSPISQPPENKPPSPNFSLNNNPPEPLKDEVYVMPEKFHPQPAKSSAGKPLIIALIILILVVAATATYFLYDMWQKSQNGLALANQNLNVNNSQNQNQNENQNENVNSDINNSLNSNAEINLNAETNTDISTSTPPENIGVYTAQIPPQISSDSDNDGLTDAEEAVVGSSPIEQDSDKDGFIDGQELAKGYSPTAPAGDNGRLPAASFIASLSTNFIKDNFKILYPKNWQATTIPATNQVVITTNTGEIIKISARDNNDRVSAANWYLNNNPQASLSQLKSLTAGDLSGVFSPNGLAAYLADADKNRFYSFEYMMDANAQFRYPALFLMVIKNFAPIIGSETTANWQAFSNEVNNYTVKYPKDWKTVTDNSNVVGFAPITMALDYQWAILVFDASQKTKEDIIREMGSQFGQSRTENRANITMGNIPATKVAVTTATIPSWYFESIFIEKNSKIYQISNGAINSDLFEPFYRSFQFIANN
ncbi:MAG: thrombospondin type 3 repeat-containing protein [Patescibacteria group bacterium]